MANPNDPFDTETGDLTPIQGDRPETGVSIDRTRDLSELSRSLSHAPGDTIGKYRIKEVLGEGGFGVVYRAEQSEPVQRDVALKVIKPGMDSRAVIARFEAERQALALMSHPGVARVYDGGLTDQGRPFFAMEFVEGQPIDAYCDEHRLGIEDRVRLVQRVCAAIQHAHTKGVVHRDIKPDNIIVATFDGQPVPKVIDFGIAKATQEPLTESTIFTHAGQMIGTPAYMSPEQAGGEDVDTRTDVYGLGAVLYELLTGTRPFEPDTLRRAAFDEVRRIIREVDPPRPSTRISDLRTRQTAQDIASVRKTETRSLTGLLRRDLDWVVMRCLEKDRERRYETPDALGADLGRFLANQPVEAGPPGAGYKLSKFVKRNRGAVVACTLLAVMLIASTVVSTTFGLRASAAQQAEATERTRAEDAAETANAVLGFFTRRFEETNPLVGADAGSRGLDGPWSASRLTEFLRGCAEAVEVEFEDRPQIRARVRSIVGASLAAMGDSAEGHEQMRLAIDTLPEGSIDRARTQIALAQSIVMSYSSPREQLDRAGALADEAIPVLEAELGAEHRDTLLARVIRFYAGSLGFRGAMNLVKGLRENTESLALLAQCQKALGPDHPVTLLCELRVLGSRAASPFGEGPVPTLEELIERSRISLGPSNLVELFATDQILAHHNTRDNVAGEIETGTRLTAIVLELLGPTHNDAVWFLEGYLAMLVHYKEFERIETFLDEHPEVERALSQRSSELAGYMAFMRGRARLHAQDLEGAALHYEQAAAIWREEPDTYRPEQHMAVMLRDLARIRKDPALMEEARAWRDRPKRFR